MPLRKMQLAPILSHRQQRHPTTATRTPEELNVALEYARSPETRGPQTLTDLTWALINSAEFLYRH